MNKPLTLFAATALAALATAGAFAIDANTSVETSRSVEHDKDGDYSSEATMRREKADGTVITKDTEATIETDDDGNVERRVETETTHDPVGLMNKTTVNTTDSVKIKDGRKEYHHEKEVNGKTVEETTVEGR